MPTAVEISQRFFEEVIVSLLREHDPGLLGRLWAGVVGTGSDAQGFDDEVSRDHHWGPRCQLVLLDDDVDRHRGALLDRLARALPEAFEGHPVRLNRRWPTEVSVHGVSDLLRGFIGFPDAPGREEDWLKMSETDLFHVTAGRTFHDGPGEFSARRERLAYYPEIVWRKRLADWCMYVTGQDAPYNLHRAAQRGHHHVCMMYLGLALRRVYQLGHLINRRYAPHTKWLHLSFSRLPRGAPEILPLLDDIVAPGAGWRRRVDLLIAVNHVWARALHDLGLTGPPNIQPFDPTLTDLTLYTSAREIYAALPRHWLALSAEQLDYWEEMAREVLFDPEDYFEQRFGARAED